MVEVIGVRFKKNGKVYYFSPSGLKIKEGTDVVVETARGVELGRVAMSNKEIEDKNVVGSLKPVIRIATDKDKAQYEENILKAKSALKECEKLIAKHKMEMTLVDAEYTFDRGKILFYFIADGRVDFRGLVKDLAAVFKTRIELRQIGVRDEAKMLKGIGVCGRPFCCATFLDDFQPVSIKMAKDQNLSLNSAKNSGGCGRLMCCLNFEQQTYEELWKTTPKPKSLVKTPAGTGVVLDVALLKGTLRVVLDSTNTVQIFNVKDIKVIKNSEDDLTDEELRELKKLED